MPGRAAALPPDSGVEPGVPGLLHHQPDARHVQWGLRLPER